MSYIEIVKGYHNSESFSKIAKWIERYPKDNDPMFKISDYDVTVRLWGGHYKRYSFEKILKEVADYG